MPISPIQTYDSYAQGRQNRLQADYSQSRNQLAAIEAQNAPQQMAQQNQLNSLKVEGAQMGIDAERAKTGYTRLKQALDSGNPRAYVLQHEPELAAKLQSVGADLNSMDDASAAKVIEGFAREYAGKAGIAPTAKLETIGDTSNPAAGVLQKNPLTGEIKQVVAPQKPDRFAETQAAADRRAEEQRTFTAEQNRLNREAQQGRADAKASAAANKPAKITEGERVSANYLNRMEKAEPLLGTYRPSTADMMAFSRILNGDSEAAASLANKFLSSEAQTHFQAASDWVRAKLRKESGAVIAPQEMIQEIKTYFPMPGDSQKNIEQKRQARATATEGMRMMAGGAAKSGPVQVKTDADYARLPSGSEYIAPDGSVRTKR